MSPELLVPNMRLISSDIDDFKGSDVWSMMMTFFMVINPDQRTPQEVDGAKTKNDMIQLRSKEQLPSDSSDYVETHRSQ